MAKSNYLGNDLLKAAGVKIPFTEEQVTEYVKCADDPEYFIETYIKIVNVDRGLVPFNLYSYQKELIQSFEAHRFVIAKIGRQQGKCLCINTPIRVRNKRTGEIVATTIGAFYAAQKAQKDQSHNLSDLRTDHPPSDVGHTSEISTPDERSGVSRAVPS